MMLFKADARSLNNAVERIVGYCNGNLYFFFDKLVESAEECTAARKSDTAVNDVG